MRITRFEDIEVQSELYLALDQKYITTNEFQDVYDHAGRTRAAIRGFIKYLLACNHPQGIKEDESQYPDPINPEPLNPEPLNPEP